MFCSKCGRKIEENQQFCDGCGARNQRYSANANSELREVVSQAMNGNEKAIEKIYSMTYAQGFSVAFQMMKHEQDALDVMQESYISAFRNLKNLEQPEKIKSWFNRIVANKCKDLLVKKKRNPQFFSDMQREDDDREFEESIMDENLTFSPEESVDYSETKRLMKQILENLPDEQRLCVLMYYYDELSVGEIAEAFYTDVKPFGERDYELAGVMDITAHKNEESKIGGFVFDKIEFKLKDEYQTSINDDVNFAVESIVRTKAELMDKVDGSVNYYEATGSYDVNQYSDKEFVFYADMFMTSALCFSNDREIVENDEGIYDGYQSLVTKYDDVCRNTLGRNEDYDMSGINKIDGDRVVYGGFMFDAYCKLGI